MSGGEEAYEELARLAEARLAMAAEGRLDELARLYDRSAAIAERLPKQPPAAARPALERAAAFEGQVGAHLAAALAETRAGLEQLERGRRAARSYASVAAAHGERSA